jgi:hypothetical protein
MNTIIIILIGILFASFGQVFWKIGMNSIGAVDNFSISGIISMFLNPLVVLGLIMYSILADRTFPKRSQLCVSFYLSYVYYRAISLSFCSEGTD